MANPRRRDTRRGLAGGVSGWAVARAGAALRVATVAIGPNKIPLGFVAPNPPALSLSTAVKTAMSGRDLRRQLVFEPNTSCEGPVEGITLGTTPLLYDFLEQAFVTVVFSVQAIESFANEEIHRLVEEPMQLSFRGRRELLDAADIVRIDHYFNLDARPLWLASAEKAMETETT